MITAIKRNSNDEVETAVTRSPPKYARPKVSGEEALFHDIGVKKFDFNDIYKAKLFLG